MPDGFFLVWSPSAVTPPRQQFKGLAQAKAVAGKLAADNPGREFFVLEAVGAFGVPPEEVPFVPLRRAS